ncbi:DUF3422 domain-containing protein [Phyllobacterium endophyticum]|uniref:DUF3422 domain-containing protein n=1 Tax=Phyllobacterium endophyticum TaxID=1149773 RepID=A0A2P7ASP5_9HYPH|nr:DUF3422 domain-containing protein [Phyllobacterium endophyticum]MBB3236958.1 putative membrane-anchored protein [Phyllobacterium endophyticum]PSH57193.1 DUF3422 domain-containing protein [Phyllobacterium endophyticum]TYR40471.1 DUF3422 domain-containing protein [Phyllobacterium endophyticum]
MRFRFEHPLRDELHNELHARPSLYFDGDTDVWHVAIIGKDGPPSAPDGLPGLEEVSTTQQGKHGIARFAGGRLKWELHTEFLTLTFVVRPSDSVGGTPPQAFQELCDRADGQVIAAVRVIVRDEKDGQRLEKPGADFVASEVGGGDAEVHSNFRLTQSGFVELLLFNRNLNAYRTGRMVRRLLEIETYRMMALLAMPVARETVLNLELFDRRLKHLIAHMHSTIKVDKTLLSDVTRLSSDVLNFSAIARQRFGATMAYAEIVTSRMEELREGRVEQRQRIGTFIDRRFQPAIRSFRAAERRLDELAGRISLAGDLLRTTVQVQLEDQNASLLTSMEERARVQVHIQQAVEGFSVIAITYYGVGLAKISLESMSGLGLDPHVAKLAVLAAIPLVLFAVFKAVHHIRRSINQSHGRPFP